MKYSRRMYNMHNHDDPSKHEGCESGLQMHIFFIQIGQPAQLLLLCRYTRGLGAPAEEGRPP